MADREKEIDTELLPRREVMLDVRTLLASARFVRWAIYSLSIFLATWVPNCASGEPAKLPEPAELPMAHDEYVYTIRFSPDGETLVTAAGDNVARIWSWPTRKLLHTLAHEAAVYAAEFSPAGEHLATGSGDGNVTLWKLPAGTEVAQRKEHADAVYGLSFSPDGKRLATIGGDGKKGDTNCRIWSIPALKLANMLPGHERPGYGVLFGPPVSPARNMLVTSGGDQLIHVYSLPTMERKTWTGHTSDVYRCCFSPDGQHLATTSQDGSVRIWNVATGELARTLLHVKDPIYDVCYSRDGRIIVAVGDDGFVRYWETRTYTLLAESKADKKGLYAVEFTPDQTRVITGGTRGVLHECPVPRVTATDRVGQRHVEKDATDANRP